jgi:L-ribulokinase
LDAHAGAVAAGIEPNVLVKVIGTSTVDLMIGDSRLLEGKNVKEICGQAEDSIIPGFVGFEAGQAAFGDILRWYRDLLVWPIRELLPLSKVIPKRKKEKLAQEIPDLILDELGRRCENPSKDDPDLIVLDWLNGRRYPHINEHVKAAISGVHLGTKAPELYKALIVGAAFGSRRIMESFVSEGLEVKRIVAVGGVAQKSPLIMQILSDVLNRPISVASSKQSCAFGAAMYAAVAAGIYKRLQDAQAVMGRTPPMVFLPSESAARSYSERYTRYLHLCSFVDQTTVGTNGESYTCRTGVGE